MSDAIDDDRVRHIAGLARLNLGEEELRRYMREMSTILEYFGQLSGVDTSNVQPLAHPLPLRNVWAEDQVRDGLSADVALGNAPEHREGFFVVPKVLEDSGA